MPELPEVEAVARTLNLLVKGRTIGSAELLRPRLAPDTTPQIFSENLSKLKIEDIGRRGKHILLQLSGGKTLIVHLRMSGRFSVLSAEQDNPKFAHAVFHFNADERLVFDDQRHFGLMKIVSTDQLQEAKELKKLAPEPFSDEFSISYLANKLRGSKRSLKEFLIDQTKVCGLGNIYACEAMFAAGVDPRKPAGKLSKPSIARLHQSIKAVLYEAVTYVGGAVPDFEGSYFNGSNDSRWYVYDREKEPCTICRSPIVRVKQGSRSTYFCRRCQRK
jgi:formamidopyrimidine-DNA glycosylase